MQKTPTIRAEIPKEEIFMSFYEIKPSELKDTAFDLFRQGFLLTAEKEGKVNTMTVGWGALGVMWGKDVLITSVRPERYTYEFMEASDTFSMAVLPAEDKKKVGYCGSVSGRDADKVAECGFTVEYADGTPYFAQSRVVFICKKLAAPALEKACFLGDDTIPDRWYNEKNGGYHTLYFGEILKILVKE
jgi:flavin reductase (DIM6/NTAB) family NADH-FMN oxidoreductase RutF